MPELDDLRSDIDEIDSKLLDLLSQRFELVRQIGVLKKQKGIDSLQQARFDGILKRLTDKSAQNELDPDMITEIWHIIHQYSLKIQK
ncbi:hypothetical protein A3F37_02995 [Candidatus Saccharibacteria bacterium RIFCSPHIGHO2_12_FULL_41_12]|nr:MAG: hypothetical protein A3F37_02995 [Candidatus Saccharibacteria bacterium RIFCSPHIGHO2_12_FULL_41_12]